MPVSIAQYDFLRVFRGFALFLTPSIHYNANLWDSQYPASLFLALHVPNNAIIQLPAKRHSQESQL